MTNSLLVLYSTGKNSKHSLKIGNKQQGKCPLLPLLFNIVLEALATAIRQEEIKGIRIGKEVKLSLFAEDIILYIENLKGSTMKLLGLKNEFSQVAVYKMNIQKSAVFFYVNNKLSEREIKKTTPFIVASKRINYLVINLTNNVKNL